MNELDVTIKEMPVTDEEKLNFFKAFLADKPYEATEELFDGGLKLKFKSLSVAESSAVFEQLRKDQQNDRVTTDAAYMMLLTNYRLIYGLVSINGEDVNPAITADYKPVDASDSYVRAKAAVLQTWPVFKLSAVAEAFKVFEDKLLFLTKETTKPGFWKAAK